MGRGLLALYQGKQEREWLRHAGLSLPLFKGSELLILAGKFRR